MMKHRRSLSYVPQNESIAVVQIHIQSFRCIIVVTTRKGKKKKGGPKIWLWGTDLVSIQSQQIRTIQKEASLPTSWLVYILYIYY